MTSCSGSCENELIVINHVYEQPVWLDVTFAEASVIAGQSVITIFDIKLILIQKHLQHVLQQVQIFSLLVDALQIFRQLLTTKVASL